MVTEGGSSGLALWRTGHVHMTEWQNDRIITCHEQSLMSQSWFSAGDTQGTVSLYSSLQLTVSRLLTDMITNDKVKTCFQIRKVMSTTLITYSKAAEAHASSHTKKQLSSPLLGDCM